MPLMNLLVDWTQIRKESVSWGIYQENPQKPERREQRQKTEQDIHGLWDIHVMGIQEEERGKGTEELSETIMTENFSKLMSDIKPQMQEAQGTRSGINARKTTAKNIIFKLEKIKDKKKSRKRGTLPREKQR